VFSTGKYSFGIVQFSAIQMVILLSSLGLMGLLWVFVQHTRYGQAIRACSQDREAAGLMGIPVNSMISLTFFIGAILGGRPGFSIVFITDPSSTTWICAWDEGLYSRGARGIGNIPGAMLEVWFLVYQKPWERLFFRNRNGKTFWRLEF